MADGKKRSFYETSILSRLARYGVTETQLRIAAIDTYGKAVQHCDPEEVEELVGVLISDVTLASYIKESI